MSNREIAMKNRKERLKTISEVLKYSVIGSQEELSERLVAKGVNVTQATLSRDLKALKVSKTPLSNGMYKYTLPAQSQPISRELTQHNFTSSGAVVSLEMSGTLAVLKTKAGYASAIALDVDNRRAVEILGTIAGDDTVLIIPREGITKHEIMEVVKQIFDEN